MARLKEWRIGFLGFLFVFLSVATVQARPSKCEECHQKVTPGIVNVQGGLLARPF